MSAKKNKRGDRGSTEEETSASKKSNMAENLDGNLEGHITEVLQ